jgi:hypothetical protein
MRLPQFRDRVTPDATGHFVVSAANGKGQGELRACNGELGTHRIIFGYMLINTMIQKQF